MSFFLTHLWAYPSWIPVLIASKALNPGWICAICTSLVKVLGQSATYCACVYSHELTISPATVADALGNTVEEDYDSPIHTDRAVVPFDVITIEILVRATEAVDRRFFLS